MLLDIAASRESRIEILTDGPTGDWMAPGQLLSPVHLAHLGPPYTQMEIAVNFFRFCIKGFGFKNSGLTLEFRVLVGIGRSGMLKGILLS